MKIELVTSTGNLQNSQEMIEFGSRCARVCYNKKNWGELQKEPIRESLLNRLIKSGHHSVFEHINLTFNFDEIPKALAMVFNNEKQYATSEKSARYTQMRNIEPIQKELYNKWMETLIPEIEKVYPSIKDSKLRKGAIKKLAQENARYMSSVFTPTKMVHTINLRQLNFLQQGFENFIEEYSDKNYSFEFRLRNYMGDFLEQTKDLRIKGLENQTDRGLSLFSNANLTPSNEYGDMYSRIYSLSFAGLAQAHRHRTISYNILGGTEMGAKKGFFIPPIVKKADLEYEWIKDLNQVSKTDFPQAQLLEVYERGRLEDFRSKALLRMCGHAQLEIMINTMETAKEYKSYQKSYGENSLTSKCLQGIKCLSPCVWTGKNALRRLI